MPIINHELDFARQSSSPNCDARPGDDISLIVIHGISLPSGQFGGSQVEQFFCNQLDCSSHSDFSDLAGLRVSSHLFVRRDGRVIQFVPFNRRAWHAGESSYKGRANCNDFSVGIELEGTDRVPYTEIQYKVLARICRELVLTYDVAPESVTGHSDIAPARKTDPGPAFNWHRLRTDLENSPEQP